MNKRTATVTTNVIDYNTYLGFKGCMKGRNIRYFKPWMRDFVWELKYAWKRVWSGYDDRDVFDMNNRLTDRLITLLLELKKNRCGLFNIPEKYGDMFDGRIWFTDEETDIIIDMIIYHLKMSNEDYLREVIYNGKYIYEFNLTNEEYKAEYKRFSSIMSQNKDLALNLIRDFWWNLWG